MGSSISRIHDDEDDYHYLCKKYKEKPEKVYSNHYRWLNELHEGTTKLTYKQYVAAEYKKALECTIKEKKKELVTVAKELNALVVEYERKYKKKK